jgi:hypothetical protein
LFEFVLIARVADHDRGRIDAGSPDAFEELVRRVLRYRSPDPEQVPSWLQPEALQDLGTVIGRRVGAIRHQLGLPAVLAPVVVLAGPGVSYDETAAPGRQALRCSQVLAREAAHFSRCQSSHRR